MVPGVGGDLVSIEVGLLDGGGVVGDLAVVVTVNKEGGLGVLLLEELDEVGGVVEWAVVEGDGHGVGDGALVDELDTGGSLGDGAAEAGNVGIVVNVGGSRGGIDEGGREEQHGHSDAGDGSHYGCFVVDAKVSEVEGKGRVCEEG